LKEALGGWAVDAECGYTGEGEEDARQLDNRTSETGCSFNSTRDTKAKLRLRELGLRGKNGHRIRGGMDILDIEGFSDDEEATRMDEDEPGEDGGCGKGT
jgi:hypothetical protein